MLYRISKIGAVFAAGAHAIRVDQRFEEKMLFHCLNSVETISCSTLMLMVFPKLYVQEFL
jgi:hypothetical protein